MECLCPPPTPHSPLKPYTLFIFQSSRSCSPTPLNFSLSSPFLQPALAQCHLSLSPPPHPHPSDPFERVSHENDIFDWPHQYVSLSIWRHSADFLEGLSSHSPLFFFLFFYSDSAPPPLQHHTLLHSCPKWEKKKGRGEDRQIDEETEREALEKKDMDNGP